MDLRINPRRQKRDKRRMAAEKLRDLLTSGKLVLSPWRIEAHGSLAILLAALLLALIILL